MTMHCNVLIANLNERVGDSIMRFRSYVDIFWGGKVIGVSDFFCWPLAILSVDIKFKMFANVSV